MNLELFEKRYGKKGGLTKLTDMMSANSTQRDIANHFGVSREAIRLWTTTLFGSYDPRPFRRQKTIENMVEFYHNKGKKEFDKAFRGSSFYKQALKIIENTIV